jgi:nucleotide-binding universal stress UspA family protein
MKLLMACGERTDVSAIAADLCWAGLPVQVDALVLSVADLVPIPDSRETGDLPEPVRRARQRTVEALHAVQRVAERARTVVHEAFPAWSIGTEFHADAPAWAILKRADEWHADLIVLCSDDRSLARRIMLGSVSQTVLTHARCPVRIVRPHRVEVGTGLRLLIGFDGSPDAEAVVAAVAARNWEGQTQARLITAFDVTLANMLGFTDGTNDERDAAERVAHRAVTRLSAAGMKASALLVDGDPREILVEQADAWNADCLFIGARGLRRIDRILLGSVSAAVAARAHCTVEVVRPPAAAGSR